MLKAIQKSVWIRNKEVVLDGLSQAQLKIVKKHAPDAVREVKSKSKAE